MSNVEARKAGLKIGMHDETYKKRKQVDNMPCATEEDFVAAAKVLAGLGAAEGVTPAEMQETFAMFGIEKHHAMRALEELREEGTKP